MQSPTKTALVTGGSRGLGKNMALALAEKGNDMIITYNSKKAEADKVVEEIRAKGRKAAAFQLNVSDIRTFDPFLKEVADYLSKQNGNGKFDFLVNNAGMSIHASVEQTTEKQLDDAYNVLFKGVFFLTQKALSYLNDKGRVITVSSGLARFCMEGFAAYASMKGAIEVFTRYLAKEVGPRGITVNAIAPGMTETDFTKPFLPTDEAGKQYVASIFAMGRMGVPDDIGGVVALLCAEEAHWVTAQRIEISGGQFL